MHRTWMKITKTEYDSLALIIQTISQRIRKTVEEPSKINSCTDDHFVDPFRELHPD